MAGISDWDSLFEEAWTVTASVIVFDKGQRMDH